MDQWAQLIRELGFPAAIAFFVIWRLDQRFLELIKEFRELRGALLGGRRLNDPNTPK